MNLNYLDSFCLVVKTGSITKAAQKLHISQPALSLQIQELENIFQTVLLERSNKGVRPTEMGQLVFTYGQKILNLLKNLQKKIDLRRENLKVELFVGASSSIGNFALPCSIYIFKEKFPQHNIFIDISDTKTVLEKMMEGSISVGVVEGPLDISFKELKAANFKTKKIAHDELVVIAPYNSKWQDKNQITIQELKELPLILREKGSGIRETIEETLREKNISVEDLNITLELNSISAIISAVAAEKGVSILPKMALRKELRHRTLKALKVEGITFHHPIFLVHPPQ